MMDENKQAILMLSTYFSAPEKGEPTPLTPLEYGRFALWLRKNQYQPGSLFSQFDEILSKWQDKKNKITRERLNFLLGRGMAMGIALEKWHSAGIWVVTRSDTEYPKRLKKHLTDNAPAVLFGVGSRKLLHKGGLSIVGSRNIDANDQYFTQCIAKQAVVEGLNIVSGGARGVDETAMIASLENKGTAVGILTNDLLKAALSKKWRQYLKQNQLLLLSTYYPEASFNIGNAMGRNKYIYCLSDHALVVRSDEGKGGTWAGATENLKKIGIPLFVKQPSTVAGNEVLIKMGAHPLYRIDDTQQPDSKDWLLNQLTNTNRRNLNAETVTKNFYPELNTKDYNDTIQNKTVSKKSYMETDPIEKIKKSEKKKSNSINSNINLPEASYDHEDFFYLYFIHYLEYLLKQQSQISLSKLKELRKDLAQKQITDWLDRAAEEEIIERKGTKRIYTKKQTDLFQKRLLMI
ncbi:MAG: DNA-processing protein DprA [Thermodesulfobacteriota bacterium]|nr:DNA-processing protein DprA [Thermodesulfobacteriota bacterium]